MLIIDVLRTIGSGCYNGGVGAGSIHIVSGCWGRSRIRDLLQTFSTLLNSGPRLELVSNSVCGELYTHLVTGNSASSDSRTTHTCTLVPRARSGPIEVSRGVLWVETDPLWAGGQMDSALALLLLFLGYCFAVIEGESYYFRHIIQSIHTYPFPCKSNPTSTTTSGRDVTILSER